MFLDTDKSVKNYLYQGDDEFNPQWDYDYEFLSLKPDTIVPSDFKGKIPKADNYWQKMTTHSVLGEIENTLFPASLEYPIGHELRTQDHRVVFASVGNNVTLLKGFEKPWGNYLLDNIEKSNSILMVRYFYVLTRMLVKITDKETHGEKTGYSYFLHCVENSLKVLSDDVSATIDKPFNLLSDIAVNLRVLRGVKKGWSIGDALSTTGVFLTVSESVGKDVLKEVDNHVLKMIEKRRYLKSNTPHADYIKKFL